MENSLTIAELKRRGMAAIEDALVYGPVHILKHNKPSAVVLSPEQYVELQSGGLNPSSLGQTVTEWLSAQTPRKGRSKADIDRMLQLERDW